MTDTPGDHSDVFMTASELAEAYGDRLASDPPRDGDARLSPLETSRPTTTAQSYLLVPLTLSQTRHMVAMLLEPDERVWLERVRTDVNRAPVPGHPNDAVLRWCATTGTCAGFSSTIDGAWSELLRTLINRRYPA